MIEELMQISPKETSEDIQAMWGNIHKNLSQAQEHIHNIQNTLNSPETQQTMDFFQNMTAEQQQDLFGALGELFGVAQQPQQRDYLAEAEAGNVEAQFALGNFYASGTDENGNPHEVSIEKAEYWYTKASEQGHAGATALLSGIFAYKAYEHLKTALKLVEQAAELGYTDAQEKLGYLYESGLGITGEELILEPNLEKALEWLKKAAERPDSKNQKKIQQYIGLIYEKQKDFDSAVEWYRKAAEGYDGDVSAQYDLGYVYAMQSKYFEAGEWLTKAKQNGHTNVDKLFERIVSFLTEKAENGDAESQWILATYYSNGYGVAQDDKKALEWTEKAAENGNVKAQVTLAKFYAFGVVVPQDNQKAKEWYLKAAENGNAEAQYNVVRFCEKGRRAHCMDEKAADNQHPEAQEKSGTILFAFST